MTEPKTSDASPALVFNFHDDQPQACTICGEKSRHVAEWADAVRPGVSCCSEKCLGSLRASEASAETKHTCPDKTPYWQECAECMRLFTERYMAPEQRSNDVPTGSLTYGYDMAERLVDQASGPRALRDEIARLYEVERAYNGIVAVRKQPELRVAKFVINNVAFSTEVCADAIFSWAQLRRLAHIPEHHAGFIEHRDGDIPLPDSYAFDLSVAEPPQIYTCPPATFGGATRTQEAKCDHPKEKRWLVDRQPNRYRAWCKLCGAVCWNYGDEPNEWHLPTVAMDKAPSDWQWYQDQARALLRDETNGVVLRAGQDIEVTVQAIASKMREVAGKVHRVDKAPSALHALVRDELERTTDPDFVNTGEAHADLLAKLRSAIGADVRTDYPTCVRCHGKPPDATLVTVGNNKDPRGFHFVCESEEFCAGRRAKP